MPGLTSTSWMRPALASPLSSGASASRAAATSTLGARFSSRRTLLAASSPPPTTRGGLRSKLRKTGKARMSASHCDAFLRRISEALGRKLDFEPVQRLGHDDLAAKPRALVDIVGAVEHLQLLVARRRELCDPVLIHPDMAGGASARPAALGLDGKAPVADHLHYPPTFEGFEAMHRA